NNLAYAAGASSNWIYGFSVKPNAAPTELTGSPFPAFPAGADIVAFACLADGPRLYAVTRQNGIQAFAVATDGSLTKLGESVHLNDSATAVPTGAVYWANSRPRLAIQPEAGGAYPLRLNGRPVTTYRLQRAPSVIGPWSTVDTNPPPASGLVEFW